MTKSIRITDVIYHYWDTLRNGQRHPDLSAVDVNSPELASVKEDIFLLQIDDSENYPDYVMIHIGANLKGLFNQGDQEYSDDLFAMFEGFLTEKFNKIYFSHKPIILEEEHNTGTGYCVKFRQCMLPLGPSPHIVNGIIGGIRYQVDSDISYLMQKDSTTTD